MKEGLDGASRPYSGPTVREGRPVEPTQPEKPIPRRLDLVRCEHHLPTVPAVNLLDGIFDRFCPLAIGHPMHGGQFTFPLSDLPADDALCSGKPLARRSGSAHDACRKKPARCSARLEVDQNIDVALRPEVLTEDGPEQRQPLDVMPAAKIGDAVFSESDGDRFHGCSGSITASPSSTAMSQSLRSAQTKELIAVGC